MTIARYAALLRPDDVNVLVHAPVYPNKDQWVDMSYVIPRHCLFTDSAIQYLQSCGENYMTKH